MKFYAVKKGKQIGIFTSWDECKIAVSNYSGPDYKAFSTREEAEAYLQGNDYYEELIQKDIKSGYIIAFTDGSFDITNQKFAYGVVIIDENYTETKLSKWYDNEKYLASNNIAGEIYGVLAALDWAVSHNYNKIKIYHDYEGIAKWANGEFNANSPIAKLYKNLLDAKFKNIIHIDFHQVKGHSNVKYNQMADELASDAIGGKIIKAKRGQDYFCVYNFNSDDLDFIIKLMLDEIDTIQHSVDNTDTEQIYKFKLSNNYLTLKYYKNHTLLIQANMNILFQMITSYIIELLDEKKIIPILQEAYKMKINDEKINTNFNSLFSNFPIDYNKNIIKLLKQSTINLNYYVEGEDYSQYVFPTLRALEGHLKYLLYKNGFNNPIKEFYMFNIDETNKYYYNRKYDNIKNENIINKIELCYNIYKKHRDSIFHFDLIGDTDQAKMFSKKTDVDQIIFDCLNVIQQSI